VPAASRTPCLACSEQLAEQSESVPSVDNLEYLMENLALGHTVVDQKSVSGSGVVVPQLLLSFTFCLHL
jgi:hypothetical protein